MVLILQVIYSACLNYNIHVFIITALAIKRTKKHSMDIVTFEINTTVLLMNEMDVGADYKVSRHHRDIFFSLGIRSLFLLLCLSF